MLQSYSLCSLQDLKKKITWSDLYGTGIMKLSA